MRTALFLVTLSKPPTQAVSIHYETVPDTATDPGDFTAVSGDIVFAPGETVRQIMVPIRDGLSGSDEEKFRVRLSAPVNCTLARAEGECVIPASDPLTQPVVSINQGIVVASI